MSSTSSSVSPSSRKPASKRSSSTRSGPYRSSLKIEYNTRIRQELAQHFNYSSPMQVPNLEKIVISTGVGEALINSKLLDSAIEELSLISGQRAVSARARKSVANFKLRQGSEIGAYVTLRSERMFDFLARLIHIALPRQKDFRGLDPNSFDGHGNYSLGITEQIVFPEIDYDKIQRISGLGITIHTTATNDVDSYHLLVRLGMPFRKR